jgi:hypothetical protein
VSVSTRYSFALLTTCQFKWAKTAVNRTRGRTSPVFPIFRWPSPPRKQPRDTSAKIPTNLHSARVPGGDESTCNNPTRDTSIYVRSANLARVVKLCLSGTKPPIPRELCLRKQPDARFLKLLCSVDFSLIAGELRRRNQPVARASACDSPGANRRNALARAAGRSRASPERGRTSLLHFPNNDR